MCISKASHVGEGKKGAQSRTYSPTTCIERFMLTASDTKRRILHQGHLAECIFVHRGSLKPSNTRELKIFASILSKLDDLVENETELSSVETCSVELILCLLKITSHVTTPTFVVVLTISCSCRYSRASAPLSPVSYL